MLKKRAQGLSVHTIIVAIIGLIILVAIILMLTGKLGSFGEGVESFGDATEKCEDQTTSGNEPSETDCDEDTEVEIISSDALPGSGKHCCKSL